MLNPEWFYIPDHDTFIAFANSDSNCSRYDFDGTGVPLRRTPERRTGSFVEAYRTELGRMRRIGTLNNHLNLQDAIRRGRRSDIVIAELRRNVIT
jgi:hypothetical protein